MSRATAYTDALAEEICDRLLDGESLVKICNSEHMPHRRTVLRWMETDDAFATRCARARELQADLMDDKIADLIDSVTPETAQAARVQLAALQWRASKLAPKKYGDKVALTGDGGGPVEAKFVMMGAAEAASTDAWLNRHGNK